ncbi:uncharacterized protein K452DRAFT_290566 [Aplosporella prunicola CBS 121167]|uniref:Uncharacterized protein n=1 Tax=Aplosporella prunicola CBS 121167 TaxID=1176127 RepID=A0A6A6B3N0_9PEZI|nr:uncharacterized protein K452DRAFT_290566 [Aplosporella prunicola CBS 121167]KAF2138426.1 hypothetical protein K452DRAFT_290566 [Aplosporella prunicola CBS 121167]
MFTTLRPQMHLLHAPQLLQHQSPTPTPPRRRNLLHFCARRPLPHPPHPPLTPPPAPPLPLRRSRPQTPQARLPPTTPHARPTPPPLPQRHIHNTRRIKIEAAEPRAHRRERGGDEPGRRRQERADGEGRACGRQVCCVAQAGSGDGLRY